jgi:hypothetical protein
MIMSDERRTDENKINFYQKKAMKEGLLINEKERL